MTLSSAMAEAVLKESLLNKLFSPKHSPASNIRKDLPSFTILTLPFQIK
jgi:hypothetical protein